LEKAGGQDCSLLRNFRLRIVIDFFFGGGNDEDEKNIDVHLKLAEISDIS